MILGVVVLGVLGIAAWRGLPFPGQREDSVDVFGQLRTFSRRQLYQAQDVTGVTSADALYVGSVDWRNPETQNNRYPSALPRLV